MSELAIPARTVLASNLGVMANGQASLQDRIAEIAPLLESFAESNERNRRLGPETVKALKSVDAFRLFAPAQFNGPAVSVVEALSR